MSQILRTKTTQTKSSIFDIKKPYVIIHKPGKECEIELANGKKIPSTCINCMNPRCMKLQEEEITCEDFSEIAHEMNKSVCPVGAIRTGKEQIEIDKSKCIGCGVCACRCPVGAIYMADGVAKVSMQKSSLIREVRTDASGKEIQEKFIDEIKDEYHTGIIQNDTDKFFESIYKKIKKLDQIQQNILARNLLIALGNHSTLSRQGNVYMRMDGFYNNEKQYGVVEIETGLDMLDVSRALLDDVAVINARYAVKKEDNHPLAVCLSMANKRTDYWQVVKDIKNVIKLQINTITFGALMILMWNRIKVSDFDRFYIDVDNSSIRKNIEKLIGRKSSISDGFLGILENSK